MRKGKVGLQATQSQAYATFLAGLEAASPEYSRQPWDAVVDVSLERFGTAAEHMWDAIAAGQPDTITIDRLGAKANREAALDGLQKVPGRQLDQYPPAMFKEGGAQASVRPG